MGLVQPAEEHLASYIAALERGWSPDNLRPEASRDQLDDIEADVVPGAGVLAARIA